MSYGSEIHPLVIQEDDRYEVEYRKGKEVIIAKAPKLEEAKDLFQWAAVRVGMIQSS